MDSGGYTGKLYRPLSEQYLPEVTVDSDFAKKFLKNLLSNRDGLSMNNQLERLYFIGHSHRKKIAKAPRKKKTFLTRKERETLNILKLPKLGWDYGALAPIRSTWREYMLQNLDLAGAAPSCSSPEWASFSMIVTKSELIGAEMKVIRSKVPSQVGISGTVVLETKMTFQIVNTKSQLKVVSKATSVFEFILDQLKFTVFGKHLVMKPGERSVKKIKSQMCPDL